VAKSIRLFSPIRCEPDYMVRDRWILRLTKIAILVAAVQALVLAFSLFERVMETRESRDTLNEATPYIPPKPDLR
jgi:hypothetical protein